MFVVNLIFVAIVSSGVSPPSSSDDSLKAYFETNGWPNPDRPLWVVVADTHGYNESYRMALRQALQLQKLIREHYHRSHGPEIRALHIGDLSDGDDLEVIEQTAKLPGEFGISKEHRYVIGGNSEYRGYAIFDRHEEAKWRQEALERIGRHAILIRGQSGALADDELATLELWPGTKIAASHKPLHPLHDRHADPHQNAIFSGWGLEAGWYRGINLRNWIGMPVVFLGHYLPGVLASAAVLPNVLPVKVDTKKLLPDLWRPVPSTIQSGIDFVLGRFLEPGYQRPIYFQKSGKYFYFDEAGFAERSRRRLTQLPRYDPETWLTMRRDVPLESDVSAILHAHTHIPHRSMTAVPNQSGELQIRSQFGLSPTFRDSTVKNAAPLWMSFVEIEGEARALFHDVEDEGRVVASQALNPTNSVETEAFFQANQISNEAVGAIPAGPYFCQRIMSAVAKGAQVDRGQKFSRMGRTLGTSARH